MKKIPIRQITAIPQEENRAGKFKIRSLEEVLSGKALTHALHKHDFYFILAVKNGSGFHEIDFVKYHVQAHSMFILRPGQVHQLELSADSRGFLLEFDSSFYQPKNPMAEYRWKKALSKNHCPVEEARFNKLLTYLGNCYSENIATLEGYIDAIRANLDLFFIEYVRQSQNPNQVSYQTSTYVQQRYDELRLLLEAHITQIKSVSQYAALLNLSVYQLKSITKTSVGKTPADLINAQIILEAKRYLLATSNQVKDIAWLLGYEDTSYFIRFFRNQTGHTPDAFRKNFN